MSPTKTAGAGCFCRAVTACGLSADGLSTAGEVEHVYDPWRYPEEWVVETFAPEGPKIVKRGDYWYMTTAVGGTAGPPTGHMVIMARSKSLAGPWENCPRNPFIRTQSAREKWWSRGHATLFEGPGGKWWMLYHGYENGYWTLGRQALLEPVNWEADGWPRPLGGDLSRAVKKAASSLARNRMARRCRMISPPTEWARFGHFMIRRRVKRQRLKRSGGTLHMAAKGKTPSDCSPLMRLGR